MKEKVVLLSVLGGVTVFLSFFAAIAFFAGAGKKQVRDRPAAHQFEKTVPLDYDMSGDAGDLAPRPRLVAV